MNCLNCDIPIKYGRTDKIFCTDKCRNIYNWKNIYRKKRKEDYLNDPSIILNERILFAKNNPEKLLFTHAKYRAKKYNLPFEIKIEDIFIPKYCPLLGIKLECNAGTGSIKNNSPTLDKIIPEMGYIKGNIWVISWKANRIKSNLDQYQICMFCTVLLKKTDEVSK